MTQIKLFSAVLLVLLGCNQKKDVSIKEAGQNESDKNIESKEIVSDKNREYNRGISLKELSTIGKVNDPIINKLNELPSLTDKDVDEWMPIKINDLERNDYQTNVAPESFTYMCSASFSNPNTKQKLDLLFMDGASYMGSAIISPYLDIERIITEYSDETGFQKIIKKDGKAYVQKYTHTNGTSVIQFTSKKRYLIKIKANGISDEELWNDIKQFQFENLPGI